MNKPLTPQEFQESLQFALDDFQRDAIACIDQGHSVVVCAPTGSGKTVIAEYAAMRAMSEGAKLFYTTPLKALSNQKFFDLKASFGEANVGLLTGDISINRDARITVMTTEIFRNMLYGVQENAVVLGGLKYVVLDECHYMNDSDRGTVWEESIIYCPESVQIVALSATVANAAELTDWINEVHHDTRLIRSDFRPVPLRFSYYDRGRMLPLFEAPGQMNRKLRLNLKGQRFSKKQRGFRPNELIALMHERDMLPAIFFTFSRKDCERHLEATGSLNLLTPGERQLLARKVDEYVARHSFLAGNASLEYIRNGFASHHAGLLPAMKHLVEILFQQGLIKAVFATETLAAGINMPARSTVITQISKRTNDGHRVLTASEFLQMSGRAGRRGMDPVGYVVVVSSQYESAMEAATLASSPADPLNSRFTPTYGMVLNLLQKHTLSEAEFLIRQSFGQFTAARRLKPLKEAQAQHSQALAEFQAFRCPYDVSDKDFNAFLQMRRRIHETARFVRMLQKQIKMHGPEPEIQRQLAHEQGKLNSFRHTSDQSPCRQCPILKKHQHVLEGIERERRKLKAVEGLLKEEHDTYWRRFLNIYRMLRETGYLGEADEPTSQGRLTAQVRTENEYALAEVLRSGEILEGLSAPELAAVLSAPLNDSTRENLFSKMRLSPRAFEAIRKIERLHRRVGRLQHQYGVDVPLSLNAVASPLVEAWARGASWEQLIAATNIGEGDIVRQFRRTADILRQLARLSELPVGLRVLAKEALRLIDREPVRELDQPEGEELEGETSEEEASKGDDENANQEATLIPFPVDRNGG